MNIKRYLYKFVTKNAIFSIFNNEIEGVKL